MCVDGRRPQVYACGFFDIRIGRSPIRTWGPKAESTDMMVWR